MRLEHVVGMARNGWTASIGIAGRHGPDYAVILSIPGVVFVEIFNKWFCGDKNQDEEFRARFKAEVFEQVRRAPNVEIREIDAEVLEMFLSLHDPDINLENSDRLILASAAVLESTLITTDNNIIAYVRKHRVIPSIIS